MNKIVLDVQINNLSKDDILIYDSARGCFLNVRKTSFLANTIKRENDLEKEIQALNERNKILNDKLNQLIDIVKENVK